MWRPRWLFVRRRGTDSRAPNQEEVVEKESQARRSFVKSSLGLGGAAALGMGVAGLAGTSLLSQRAEAHNPAGSTIVINNPSGSTQAHNKVQPTDTAGIPLQIKRFGTSAQNLFEIMDSDVGETRVVKAGSTGGVTISPRAANAIPLTLKAFASQTADVLQILSNAGATFIKVDNLGRLHFDGQVRVEEEPTGLLFIGNSSTGAESPIQVWDVRLGNSVVRTKLTSGFREIAFRDSNFTQEGGLGRPASLIYGRHEPQEVCHIQHFPGGEAPPEWFQAGSGTFAPLNARNGQRRMEVGAVANNSIRFMMDSSDFSFQYELHCEFYMGAISNLTDIVLLVGMLTGDIADPAFFPSDGVFWHYDSAVDTKWHVVVREDGVTTANVATSRDIITGRTFLRFEAWPLGQLEPMLASNTIKAFHADANNGSAEVASVAVGNGAAWTTLFRPIWALKNKVAVAGKNVDIDAFKGFQRESWR